MGLNWLTGEAPKQHRMRLAERHEAHGLRCPLGELLDLSVTGLRCKCEQKPQVAKGAVIPLVLQNNSQTIRLMARVVWVRKANLIGGTWQVGLHFLDVRPGIRAAIEQFALASEAAVRAMDGKSAKRVVVVPGRLVNIVA